MPIERGMRLRRGGFAWVASGGLLYTVGIGFYALDAPRLLFS